MENSTSNFGECLGRQFHSTINQFKILFNEYGVVVLLGLMFATIICYLCGFVTYN